MTQWVFLLGFIFLAMVCLVIYKRIKARYAMQAWMQHLRNTPSSSDAPMWVSDDENANNIDK